MVQLPFSVEQFLELFGAYSESIGIAPVLLTALALALVALANSNVRGRHRAITAGLAVLWLWSGIVYHWGFFTRINPLGWIFGGAFVVQALLLVIADRAHGGFEFSPAASGNSGLGWGLIAFALVVYPLIGFASGHGYPRGPSFGTPCPMTIFYFGMMCLTSGRIRPGIVIVPLLWSVVGTSAAMQLGIREDFALAVAAAAVVVTMLRRGRQPPAMHARVWTDWRSAQ